MLTVYKTNEDFEIFQVFGAVGIGFKYRENSLSSLQSMLAIFGQVIVLLRFLPFHFVLKKIFIFWIFI